MIKRLLITTALLFTGANLSAQQPEVVEMSATVTGNQEQPKVIYIVPWKNADDDAILYQPLNGKTNSIFGHVERSEHLRELKFLDELSKDDS